MFCAGDSGDTGNSVDADPTSGTAWIVVPLPLTPKPQTGLIPRPPTAIAFF